VDNDQQRFLEGNTRGLTGERYGPQMIADEMLKFVRENKDRPFFCYYPTVIPHLSLQVPEEELAQYRGQWPETPYTGQRYLPNPTPRTTYAAMISFMDKQVGRLLNLLDELNLADNTIVFFTSDNGTTTLKDQVDYEFFNSVGPLRGLKGSLYEGGIRVPLVVRWPGRIEPASVSHLPAAKYDVMATLAELTGAKPASGADSVSLLPTLLGESARQKQRQYLFWDFTGYGGQLAVRMGKWKAVKMNVIKNADAPLELYNLEEDIGEKHDVAKQFPDVAATMEKIMVEGRTMPEAEQFRFGKYRE
jgi:arylsulfatase A-like enzyme